MILRNKQTGEVMTAWAMNYSGFDIRLWDLTSNWHTSYDSLAALNEEWEDVSDDDVRWFYLLPDGTINDTDLEESHSFESVGNYFRTKEGAEEAVKKLKAFERLRRRGFKFSGWETKEHRNGGIVHTSFNLWDDIDKETVDDLDICFGSGHDE